MIPPRGVRRAGVRAGARLLLAGALALVLAVVVWTGCSVTHRNYNTLSFFFDGVPDPSAAPAAGSLVGARTPENVVVHRPYAEERCDACHRGKTRPTRNDSSLCLQCHAGVTTEHEHMHGPVAAAACMWCHSPHESRYAALLRAPDRQVCSQCHTPALLSTHRVPAHADASRACLECHLGHGGSRPFLLRESAPLHPPAPPAAPAPEPAHAPPAKT